jgi:hypothetical protein
MEKTNRSLKESQTESVKGSGQKAGDEQDGTETNFRPNRTAEEIRTQHTPGPWKNWLNHDILGPDADGIHDKTIATLFDPCLFQASDEQAANASLIAAAPELLAACNQFLSYCNNGRHPQWNSYFRTNAGGKMLAAIIKAEGRSK